MKQIQQEDLFAWFQNLSGAKRIELLCGLISMCIPLETRFFETIIQDVVKRDAHSFYDAEMKANTYQELEMVCKCDLLLEKINPNDHHYYNDEHNTIIQAEMNGNIGSGKSIVMANNNNNINIVPNQNNTATMVNSTTIPSTTQTSNDTTIITNSSAKNINTTTNNNSLNNKILTDNTLSQSAATTSSSSTSSPSSLTSSTTTTTASSNTNNNNNNNNNLQATAPTISQIISNYPSRSKLIISLCLLRPTNSTCSSLVFNCIRKQLTPENVYNAVYNVYLPKNLNIEQLFSELLLLLTMAMYHPAFTYEQRDVLGKLKKDLEDLYYEIMNVCYLRSQHLIPLNANAVAAAAAAAAAAAISAPQPPPTALLPTSGSPAVASQQAITSGPSSLINSGQPTLYHPSHHHHHHPSTNPSGPPPPPTQSPQAQQPQQPPQTSQPLTAAQTHHTQATSHQYHHAYHQSAGAGTKSHHHHHHHGTATMGPPNATATLVATGPPQQSYALPFIGNPMQMANIAYTAAAQQPPSQQPVPGPMTNMNSSNQPPPNNANALIQNMALLKVNSPHQPQQQQQQPSSSSTPSPSQSPSSSVASVNSNSNKIPVLPVQPQSSTNATNAATNLGPPHHPFSIKLHDPSIYNPTNSLITIVDSNTAVPAICIPAPPGMVMDDGGGGGLAGKPSLSSTTSSSCYNCGNMGHRGTECTTIVGGNSAGDE